MCDPLLFGAMITTAIQNMGELFKQEDVPIFLSTKHPLLGGKSPLELLWTEHKEGMHKVIAMIHGMESGSFN